MVKNSPANAGDMGSIPGSGRSLGEANEEMATHSSIHAWENPWTEGAWWGFSPWGPKIVGYNLED